MADPSTPAPTTLPSSPGPTLRTSGAAIAVATLGANVLVYGVFLVLARALSPADLGAFSALGNLVVISGVPALALQLVAARHVAREADDPVPTAVRTGLVLGAAGTVLLLVLAPVVTLALDLPGPAPALLLAAAVLPTYLAYAAQGCLQGRHRFVALGAVLLALAGGRFLAAVVGGAVGFGVTGVLGLTVLSTWLAAGVGVALVRRDLVGAWWRRRDTWLGAVLRGTTATSALLVVTNLDTPLARALLTPDEAGGYAVLAVFAKAAYWGPAFLATLFYPRMAAATSPRAALAAVGSTAALGVTAVVGATLLADPLVAVVGGERYGHLAGLVPLLTGVGAAWSVAQVLVYWRLSRGDHRLGWLVWTVAALVVATVLVRHDGVADVAAPLLVGGLVVAVWGTVLLVAGRGVSARRRARSGPPRR